MESLLSKSLTFWKDLLSVDIHVVSLRGWTNIRFHLYETVIFNAFRNEGVSLKPEVLHSWKALYKNASQVRA